MAGIAETSPGEPRGPGATVEKSEPTVEHPQLAPLHEPIELFSSATFQTRKTDTITRTRELVERLMADGWEEPLRSN